MAIINWYKNYTETLAETLKRFRYEYPEYKSERVTYAGRLDPMAEGVLILLTGDDVHQKDIFLHLPKIYEVTFFIGAETDTYDILGRIIKTSEKNISSSVIQKSVAELIHITEQVYPDYSSKPVDGKPLFMWSREGKLSDITKPKRRVEISTVEYVSVHEKTSDELSTYITENIKKVVGDFRQDESISDWQNFFEKGNQDIFKIHTMRISCSSGTYMRTLVKTLGNMKGVPMCTLNINRIQVGDMSTIYI